MKIVLQRARLAPNPQRPPVSIVMRGERVSGQLTSARVSVVIRGTRVSIVVLSGAKRGRKTTDAAAGQTAKKRRAA